MKLSCALVRSTSMIGLAAGLMMASAANAQTATDPQANPAAPADPQQGTPQADTTPASDIGAPTSPTNAVPDSQPGDDIVVTGVRASLERSIAIKRDSNGVVDAISAEDIGKFANTNLAESLQRITGVSIDRRNGEGSTVTVRGFGAQYNLVTLNGRQLATSNIVAVGGDQGGDGAGCKAGKQILHRSNVHAALRHTPCQDHAARLTKEIQRQSALTRGGCGRICRGVNQTVTAARHP